MTGCPLAGSSRNRPSPWPWSRKSNIAFRLPATASMLPGMRGRPQLSSTNRMIEDWSVSVWSTALRLAQGEITRNGCRGPYPQRPCWPAMGVPVPQAPGPVSASATDVDGLVTPL